MKKDTSFISVKNLRRVVPAEFVGSSLHACTQVSARGLMKEILEMERG